MLNNNGKWSEYGIKKSILDLKKNIFEKKWGIFIFNAKIVLKYIDIMYSKILEIMHRGEKARMELFLQNKFLLSMLLSVFSKQFENYTEIIPFVSRVRQEWMKCAGEVGYI